MNTAAAYLERNELCDYYSLKTLTEQYSDGFCYIQKKYNTL